MKLTSIMRDLAVKMDELGDNSGTYRINDANFWGGPEYAMKVVNECFGMNIQYYATVNFFGFQKIAEALGGIEVDITEAERDEINQKLLEQYRIARAIGEDMPTVEEDYLHNFGQNTHLNGHQTLAYARVRKSDGSDSDFTRAERQRTVLVKLMEKLKGRSAVELMAMVSSLSQYVTLNMDMEFVLNTATKVLNSGFGSVETLRLPSRTATPRSGATTRPCSTTAIGPPTAWSCRTSSTPKLSRQTSARRVAAGCFPRRRTAA